MVKSFTTSRLLLFFVLIGFVIISFENVEAQTSTTEPVYYNIPDLNTAEYAKIKSSMNGDGRFEIVEACIPAGIISVKTSTSFENSEERTSEFRGFVSENSSLSDVKLLEDFDQEKFMTRCKEFRMKR